MIRLVDRLMQGVRRPMSPILCTARLTRPRQRVMSLQNRGLHIPPEDLCSKYLKHLEACSITKELRQVHAHILLTGLDQHIFLCYKLICAYDKCHSVEDARLVVEKTQQGHMILWNSILRVYSKNASFEKTLELYCQMQRAGFHGDNFTFTSVLKACGFLSDLRRGKQLHVHIITNGLDSELFTANALLAMYAKCGLIEDARNVFDKMSQRDVVSWNSMIGGYTQNGSCSKAMELYHQMKAAAEIKPDFLTFVSVLPSCSDVSDLHRGKGIHACVLKNALESHLEVGNALIAMYAKCDSIENALQVFEKMIERDVVSWTTIITGYVQNGQAGEALKVFHKMQKAAVRPNAVTIISVLPACTHLVAFQRGKEVHNSVIRNRFESDVFVASALIDMYARCGSVKNAYRVFDKMSHKDSALWTPMIAAYGMHGHGDEALNLFDRMQELGYKPDHITFVAVLSACSHAGMVDKGWLYFNKMSDVYCIIPRPEHYACMVDLLGRAGHLDEAYDFIKKMPTKPNDEVWGALLGACKIHQNIQLGEHVAEHLYELKPKKAGYYVLMSNIYAAAGRWDGVAKVRAVMKDKGVTKEPGYAWIEIKNKIHAFRVEDRTHSQSAEIYKTLEVLAKQMKEAGYVPNKNFVLQDVEEEEKEHILGGHSEKLAIAFGLMNTYPGTPIRIIKNLRICGDCHHATKFISRIIEREIIIRDISRFHHFKNGKCSCGDYW